MINKFTKHYRKEIMRLNRYWLRILQDMTDTILVFRTTFGLSAYNSKILIGSNKWFTSNQQ